MVTTENLLAVISNIHGINNVTRNKMKGALTRGEFDNLDMLINHNPYDNHIATEVQVALSTMLANLKK